MNNLSSLIQSRAAKKDAIKNIGVVALSAFLLTACATSSKVPSEVTDVRNKLTSLQANSQLASRAPVAVKEAETAVAAAEKIPSDKAEAHHLVWVADHKIDIAKAQAEARLLEDQRKALGEDREKARLESRTLEADAARSDAERAKQDAEAARKQAEDLQRQVAELNAKATDRGLVVTLGDLLFETGKAELKGGAAANLGKLAAFLTQYPDRTVTIEGHTDNVGADDYNLGLSQRRANSVQQYLLAQGIAANRLTAVGKGENFPVASNDSASGRQMNRRVEVIIANVSASK
jgi:outer membrane protein OmpA-like peptidoglycan-associated protein